MCRCFDSARRMGVCIQTPVTSQAVKMQYQACKRYASDRFKVSNVEGASQASVIQYFDDPGPGLEETAVNPACWALAWHAKDKGSSMSRVDLPIVVGVQKTGADGRHGRLEVQIVVVMAEGNIGHRRLTKIEQVVHGLRPIVKSHDGQRRLMRVCGS